MSTNEPLAISESQQMNLDTEPEGRWKGAFREMLAGGPGVAIGALILAFLVGSIMIAFTNAAVREAASYFFARPQDFFSALGSAMGGAYSSLIRGSIFNWEAPTFQRMISPLLLTLHNSGPLICAGLGVAVTFKAGLFNIGGRGQMLMAAVFAGWLAFGLPNLPVGIHLIVCILGGILGGALWGALAGFLNAKTGAHEVIATIMLNYVALYLLQYLLATPGLMQNPGSSNPITPATPMSAQLPRLFGRQFPLNAGFLIALLAVAFCWWLLNRSSLGFAFKAVGENKRAAKVAGINTDRMTITVFAISGALLALAGAMQVLGTVTTGFTDGIDGGIGFDGITVALLGGSQPVGVLFAGLLFGAFKAGGSMMQAGQMIPIEIVSVIQSLIVLFIAAPPLVRAIFHLPQPSQVAAAKKAAAKAAKAEAKAAAKKEVSA
ncbi:MAG: ABC transporter permease [Cellulomonadaceae bacterium]|jgi:simple sugar transport system permease protein|nr:ABC transporter permease [Cellulomonadaceae bacterium]